MAPVPIPLTWKRRSFAVLEPLGLPGRLTALAVTGIVAGPFAIYHHHFGGSFTLMHLPSQVAILSLQMQSACKHAAEEFAALDLNWWTCAPDEVIGPDLQAMRNIHMRLKGVSWIAAELPRDGRRS
jgi:hypothetical protein